MWNNQFVLQFSAIQCSLPKRVKNAITSSNKLVHGSPIRYTCREGTRMKSGQSWTIVTCRGNGRPSMDDVTCTGK